MEGVINSDPPTKVDPLPPNCTCVELVEKIRDVMGETYRQPAFYPPYTTKQLGSSPIRHCSVMFGPPGCGKTSFWRALANQRASETGQIAAWVESFQPGPEAELTESDFLSAFTHTVSSVLSASPLPKGFSRFRGFMIVDGVRTGENMFGPIRRRVGKMQSAYSDEDFMEALNLAKAFVVFDNVDITKELGTAMMAAMEGSPLIWNADDCACAVVCHLREWYEAMLYLDHWQKIHPLPRDRRSAFQIDPRDKAGYLMKQLAPSDPKMELLGRVVGQLGTEVEMPGVKALREAIGDAEGLPEGLAKCSDLLLPGRSLATGDNLSDLFHVMTRERHPIPCYPGFALKIYGGGRDGFRAGEFDLETFFAVCRSQIEDLANLQSCEESYRNNPSCEDRPWDFGSKNSTIRLR